MKSIDVQMLRGAFLEGAKRLSDIKEEINELNVFPVPDGDTGTNMSMTVESAMDQVLKLDGEAEAKALCKAISQGALMGARGNSGVILSQLFRGFYKVMKTADTIDCVVLAQAFSKATETAYRAVMNPKEGTILTIAKAISDRACESCNEDKDIGVFYDELVHSAKAMLKKTPDMLPVLKQAGVVDSGGRGLVAIMEGAADFINNRESQAAEIVPKETKVEKTKVYSYSVSLNICSKSIIESKDAASLKAYLEEISQINSYNQKDTDITIDIETDAPGKVLNRALKLGMIDNVSIINLSTDDLLPNKDVGFVAVSIGDGLDDIFKELGVDVTIKGGQTMNPSTDDILGAIKKARANTVFVLPNNKNIQLAAKQAADLATDTRVIIIPSVTIPQGITAMLSYIPDNDVDTNKAEMEEAIEYVKTGEVTHAVRDTSIDNKAIKQGDYMGIGEGKIISVAKKIDTAVMGLIKELLDEESSMITIYYGEETKVSDATKLQEKIMKKYPDIDVDVQMGGQPVYYYLLSVE